jgi:hypothetical protein
MMIMAGGNNVKYYGSFDTAKKIYQKEGIKSFFRGVGGHFPRSVMGGGILSSFDILQNIYVKFKYLLV